MVFSFFSRLAYLLFFQNSAKYFCSKLCILLYTNTQLKNKKRKTIDRCFKVFKREKYLTEMYFTTGKFKAQNWWMHLAIILIQSY